MELKLGDRAWPPALCCFDADVTEQELDSIQLAASTARVTDKRDCGHCRGGRCLVEIRSGDGGITPVFSFEYPWPTSNTRLSPHVPKRDF